MSLLFEWVAYRFNLCKDSFDFRVVLCPLFILPCIVRKYIDGADLKPIMDKRHKILTKSIWNDQKNFFIRDLREEIGAFIRVCKCLERINNRPKLSDGILKIRILLVNI